MSDIKFDLIVIGGGPAGYVAALWSAQRGARTAVVEKKYLGGTCLNVGCIPSKALIHCVELLDMAKEGKRFGITFGEPQVDMDKVRAYKDRVVKQLVSGVEGLLKGRAVEVFRGTGVLTSPTTVRVFHEEGHAELEGGKIVVCSGSVPVCLPICDYGDPHIMTSDNAVSLPGPPESLAVIGGGAIGLAAGILPDAPRRDSASVSLCPAVPPSV